MTKLSDIDSFLVAYTGNIDAAERTTRELKRVGFRSVRLEWNFQNPYDKILLGRIPHSELFDKNIGFFNCAVTHYRIIRIAYDLRYQRIVIAEDDCRFRKDITKDTALPDDDLILLDSIPGRKQDYTPSGAEFEKFDSMRSSACYCINRKCMERLIWLYESAANPKVAKRKARLSDQWFESKYLKDLSIVRANPNMAVQQTQPTKRNSGNSWRLDGYRKLVIDLDQYMPF